MGYYTGGGLYQGSNGPDVQLIQGTLASYPANAGGEIDDLTPIRMSVTTHEKTSTLDLSSTWIDDLYVALDEIFIRQNESVNRRQVMSMDKPLLFIDGDDEQQIKWAKKTIDHYQAKVRLVLTQGSILYLKKIFALPIYFDQKGRLTTKFNIKHVPAIVEQDVFTLKVREVRP